MVFKAILRPVCSANRLARGRGRGMILLALLAAAGPSVRTAAADDVRDHLRRGLTAKSEGKWEEAETALNAAVAEAGKAGVGKVDQAEAYQALAGFLHERGKYAGAVQAYRGALSRWAELFGEKSSPYCLCLNSLGQAHSDLGLNKEAREELERSVQLTREVTGGLHPALVKQLNGLAVHCRREGKYDEAVRHYTEALAVARKLPAVEPVVVVALTLNLGVALTEQGEPDKADVCLSECASLLEKFQRTRSVEYAAYLHAAARLKLKQKQTAAARECAERGAEVCKEAVGEKHPRYATSLEVLGEVRLAEESFGEAGKLFDEVISIREAALGVNAPQVAESYAKKAKAARGLKRPGEAATALKKSHEILLAAFEGKIPGHYRGVVEDYAEVLRGEGRADDALKVSATVLPR